MLSLILAIVLATLINQSLTILVPNGYLLWLFIYGWSMFALATIISYKAFCRE